MTFDELDDRIEPIKAPITKVITVWAAVYFSNSITMFHSIPWGDISNFVAVIYTVLLIVEFVRKKMLKGSGSKHKSRKTPSNVTD